MYREETKFLDLDIVTEQILDSGNREMFREAVRCYHIGSHRAAIILGWIATADCLKRRLEKLSIEADPVAQNSWNALEEVKNTASYEEKLIISCRECELFDTYEEKCLRFARDIRSKCAHPSEAIPSAEAVRHILEICSQIVLCRSSYRGSSFIKDVVTNRFSSSFFLPSDQRAAESCKSILDQVPARLWHLFPSLAAQERPNASNETWRKNALTFFKILLNHCSDSSLVSRIADGMQGFAAQAPDFFAVLVGLDVRVSDYCGKQQRDEARAILAALPAPQLKSYNVESWATLCLNALEEEDISLLRRRLGIFSRYLPSDFLDARREDIFTLLAEMAEDDSTSRDFTIALKRLLASNLGETTDENSKRVLRQIVLRFSEETDYRDVLLTIESWKDRVLKQFLTLSEDFVLECSEDNPEDIYSGSLSDEVQPDPKKSCLISVPGISRYLMPVRTAIYII